MMVVVSHGVPPIMAEANAAADAAAVGDECSGAEPAACCDGPTPAADRSAMCCQYLALASDASLARR